MNLLYQHVKQEIEKYQRQCKLDQNTKLVLAFSGGMDSRVLLELLSYYQTYHQQKCLAVHINHGLSTNATYWQEQCKNWAQEVNIDFVSEQVHLDLSLGESIEQLARTARYRALEKYLSTNDMLLTAHHMDDQSETFLLALKRGSGPKGLSSMASISKLAKGFLVRPLLNISRIDIEKFAYENGLNWIEDESNFDTRYDRNFVRHKISPLLVKRWPAINSSIARSAALCAEQEDLLEELIQPILHKVVTKNQSLNIKQMLAVAEQYNNANLLCFRLIRTWLTSFNIQMPSRVHITMILKQIALAALDANPKLQLPEGEVRRFKGELYWLAKQQDISNWYGQLELEKMMPLPNQLGCLFLLKTEQLAKYKFVDVKFSWSLKLPADFTCFEVIFDPRGLTAHPTTRGHSRKLKKLFQEYQIPSWQRRQMPIILLKKQVVAVADLFVDCLFIGDELTLLWLNKEHQIVGNKYNVSK